jgi:hypothetical protein
LIHRAHELSGMIEEKLKGIQEEVRSAYEVIGDQAER